MLDKFDTACGAIKSDLKGAKRMVGQAQERLKNRRELWRELGKLYDDIDNLLESIEQGDYDYDISEGL